MTTSSSNAEKWPTTQIEMVADDEEEAAVGEDQRVEGSTECWGHEEGEEEGDGPPVLEAMELKEEPEEEVEGHEYQKPEGEVETNLSQPVFGAPFEDEEEGDAPPSLEPDGLYTQDEKEGEEREEEGEEVEEEEEEDEEEEVMVVEEDEKGGVFDFKEDGDSVLVSGTEKLLKEGFSLISKSPVKENKPQEDLTLNNKRDILGPASLPSPGPRSVTVPESRAKVRTSKRGRSSRVSSSASQKKRRVCGVKVAQIWAKPVAKAKTQEQYELLCPQEKESLLYFIANYVYRHTFDLKSDDHILFKEIIDRIYGGFYPDFESFVTEIDNMLEVIEAMLKLDRKQWAIKLKHVDTLLKDIQVCLFCQLNLFKSKSHEWFAKACKMPHILVWAQVKGHPYWPAKVVGYVRKLNGMAFDCRFFGENHEQGLVDVKRCYQMSEKYLWYREALKSRSGKGLPLALKELETHISRVRCMFPSKFTFAPDMTPCEEGKIYICESNRIEDIVGDAENELFCSSDLEASADVEQFNSIQYQPTFSTKDFKNMRFQPKVKVLCLSESEVFKMLDIECQSQDNCSASDLVVAKPESLTLNAAVNAQSLPTKAIGTYRCPNRSLGSSPSPSSSSSVDINQNNKGVYDNQNESELDLNNNSDSLRFQGSPRRINGYRRRSDPAARVHDKEVSDFYTCDINRKSGSLENNRATDI